MQELTRDTAEHDLGSAAVAVGSDGHEPDVVRLQLAQDRPQRRAVHDTSGGLGPGALEGQPIRLRRLAPKLGGDARGRETGAACLGDMHGGEDLEAAVGRNEARGLPCRFEAGLAAVCPRKHSLEEHL
jgi:hypothetical protein